MDEFAPESDLMADVDGVAMAAGTATTGFAFNPSATLSSNLERFYFPTKPREGRYRRFHIFCDADGLTLEKDGVTLTAAAVTSINNRVQLNTDWFETHDPDLLKWVTLNSGGGLINPIRDAWINRANDWKWFADKFRAFVQKNLTAEGK